MRRATGWAFAAVAAAVCGCSDDDRTLFTDPQIIAIAGVGDRAAIDQSALAVERAISDQVRDVANLEIADHRALQDQLDGLAARIGAGEPTPTSDQLAAEQADALERLRAEPAATFDPAWLDQAIDLHIRLRSLLDENLIAAATDDGLRDYLETMLGVVLQDLDDLSRVRRQVVTPD